MEIRIGVSYIRGQSGHVELRQFWRRKGVKHSINMVFLIIL